MYDKINETEKSIVYLIGKGYTNQEIAENLGKAKATISTYIFHLCRQHGAKNRIDLYNKLRGEI